MRIVWQALDASGFGIYSGTDKHTTYAYDREGFRFTENGGADGCTATMKDGDKAGLTIPATLSVSWSGAEHELRMFKASDKPRADAMMGLFGSIGLQLKLVDLSMSYSGARDFRPNTFEIWFGTAPMPAACALPKERVG